MQSQPDVFSFDPIQWDESTVYDAEDDAMDRAADEYSWLCTIVADLEDLNDDDQVSYMSDLDLTPAQYRSLDAIRNQTTEVHA